MTSLQTTPAFPEGSTVRDRVTGKTHTVGQFSTLGNSSGYWTTVVLPQPDDDGCRVMMLPTDELELEPVDGAGSDDTPATPEGFTGNVLFSDDDTDTIHAKFTSYGDLEVGYRLDFEGRENGVEGSDVFVIDRRHIGDFVALLQRVTDSL